MPNVLLTGATGFIGSHACVEVMAAGWTPVIIDNLCNSSPAVLDRIERITGRRPAFVKADVRDREALDRIFGERTIDAVVHFAGLKAVGESVAEPLRYYENNVVGTTVLLEAMNRHDVKRIVFSSSATVYGMAEDDAAARGLAAGGGQSVRAHEAHGGADSARRGDRRRRVAGHAAAIFQSGRRARERPDRRGSRGNAQQPHALRRPGGRRAGSGGCASTAATTRQRTEREFATTSMSSTLRWDTLPRSASSWLRTPRARPSSILAPGADIRYSKS